MAPRAALCLALALALAYQVSGSARLVIFGDSFTDQSNIWLASNRQMPPENHGYQNGRATNGLNWVDYINQKSPSTSVLNYAFPGATNCFPPIPAFPADWPPPVPSTPIFQDQYDQARKENVRLNFDDQVFVWMGANDLVQIMVQNQLLGGNKTANQTIADAQNIAVCMSKVLEAMLRDGYTKSLTVATIQAIQLQPIWYYQTGAASGDPGFRSMVYSLVDQSVRTLNAAIMSSLADLAHRYRKGVRVQAFDLHGLYQDVYSNAGVFGFTNLTWSCLQGDPLTAITEQPATIIGFMCTDPRNHMFWDSSHPTTWMHSIIADNLYPVLKMAGRALD